MYLLNKYNLSITNSDQNIFACLSHILSEKNKSSVSNDDLYNTEYIIHITDIIDWEDKCV